MQLRNKLIALLGLNIFNYIQATPKNIQKYKKKVATLQPIPEEGNEESSENLGLTLSQAAITTAGIATTLATPNRRNSQSGKSNNTNQNAKNKLAAAELFPLSGKFGLGNRNSANILNQPSMDFNMKNHALERLKTLAKDVQRLDKDKIGLTIAKSQRIVQDLNYIVSSMEDNSVLLNKGSKYDYKILDHISFILSYAINNTGNFTKKMNTLWYGNCKRVFEYICNNYNIVDTNHWDYQTSLYPMLKAICNAMLRLPYPMEFNFNNINNSSIVRSLLESDSQDNSLRKETIQSGQLAYKYLTNVFSNKNTRSQDLATGQIQLFNYIALFSIYKKAAENTMDSTGGVAREISSLMNRIKNLFSQDIIDSLHNHLYDIINTYHVNNETKERYQKYQDVLEDLMSFDPNVNIKVCNTRKIDQRGLRTEARRQENLYIEKIRENINNIYQTAIKTPSIEIEQWKNLLTRLSAAINQIEASPHLDQNILNIDNKDIMSHMTVILHAAVSYISINIDTLAVTNIFKFIANHYRRFDAAFIENEVVNFHGSDQSRLSYIAYHIFFSKKIVRDINGCVNILNQIYNSGVVYILMRNNLKNCKNEVLKLISSYLTAMLENEDLRKKDLITKQKQLANYINLFMLYQDNAELSADERKNFIQLFRNVFNYGTIFELSQEMNRIADMYNEHLPLQISELLKELLKKPDSDLRPRVPTIEQKCIIKSITELNGLIIYPSMTQNDIRSLVRIMQEITIAKIPDEALNKEELTCYSQKFPSNNESILSFMTYILDQFVSKYSLNQTLKESLKEIFNFICNHYESKSSLYQTRDKYKLSHIAWYLSFDKDKTSDEKWKKINKNIFNFI